MVLGADGRPEQVVHESDFLVAPWSEWFFVLAIFGVEFTINLGDPEIDGSRPTPAIARFTVPNMAE